jgi:hypothetical protein
MQVIASKIGLLNDPSILAANLPTIEGFVCWVDIILVKCKASRSRRQCVDPFTGPICRLH